LNNRKSVEQRNSWYCEYKTINLFQEVDEICTDGAPLRGNKEWICGFDAGVYSEDDSPACLIQQDFGIGSHNFRRRFDCELHWKKAFETLHKLLLEDAGAEYTDLVYHAHKAMRLGPAKLVQSLISLIDEIVRFLETRPRKFPELEDSSWN